MAATIESVLEPFVRRGLFATPEGAVRQMARDFVLRQIEFHRSEIAALEAKYGMNYEQFDKYLAVRSQKLIESPSQSLNRAVMAEEDDALTWKSSIEMLDAWLGLGAEAEI